MQDYNDMLNRDIDNHIAFSQKWRSLIDQQSSMSSYYTTKNVHSLVVRTPEIEAEILKIRVEEIKSVINNFKLEVEKIYPRKNLCIPPKHYRSRTIKRSLKVSHESLSVSLERLKELRQMETNMLTSCEITANENHLDRPTKEQLDRIKEDIARVEENYKIEQENHLTTIEQNYQRCRISENERLELIRNTLFEFIKLANPSKTINEQHLLYERLITTLNAEYNTIGDLNRWASEHGIRTSAIATKKPNGKRRESDDCSIPVRMRASRNEAAQGATTTLKDEESNYENGGKQFKIKNNPRSVSVISRKTIWVSEKIQ